MRQNLMFIALVVVACGVVGYHTVSWFTNSAAQSPDELATTALQGASLDERESAAVALIDHGAGGTSRLRQLLAESDDDQVRAAAIEGLGKAADFQSMDLLLAALDDESSTVRGRAGFVVGRMLGRDRRFQADAPLADRQRIAAYYRADWDFLRQSPQFDEYQRRFAAP